MSRRTEKDEKEEEEGKKGEGEEGKEEEASKCYFRNSFCPFMSVFEEVEDGEKEN